jgi:hypothetical protein
MSKQRSGVVENGKGWGRRMGKKNGVASKGRVAQIGSFEKKIVQKVAMVC